MRIAQLILRVLFTLAAVLAAVVLLAIAVLTSGCQTTRPPAEAHNHTSEHAAPSVAAKQ